MNERFKQIAQEVFFDESTTGKPGQKMYIFGELKMQKFAELIVNECLEIVEDEDDGSQDTLAVRWAMHRIRKHFGVEE